MWNEEKWDMWLEMYIICAWLFGIDFCLRILPRVSALPRNFGGELGELEGTLLYCNLAPLVLDLVSG